MSDVAIFALVILEALLLGGIVVLLAWIRADRKRNKQMASSLPPLTKEQEELERMWEAK